jgi:hypothetical protein
MTTINLNQPPYFDDFNENKKYYQILFRPGRAVQARELNQLQTILKNQLDRLGKFVFDNGSVVYPIGADEAAKYFNDVSFVKIPATEGLFTNNEANLNTYWVGKTVRNEFGVTAKVIGARGPDSINQSRLYLNYIEAGGSGAQAGTQLKFTQNQSIQTVESLPISVTISSGDNAIGLISAVTIQKSIYFYNGRFVLVDEQTLFITPSAADLQTDSKWINTPTASIGLEFIESVETWLDDSALLDNATGTPNIGAPGADRLRVAANLIQLDTINEDSLNEIASKKDYVEIFRIISGDVKKRNTKTSLADIGLEKQLATRTFEESGDYTVRPFQIQIKEFLRNETNNGAFIEETFQYSSQAAAEAASVSIFGLTTPQSFTRNGFVYPGTSYDGAEKTSFKNLCADRLSVTVDPGLAYVNGYRIEKISTTDVPLKKARELKFRNNKITTTPLGNYIFAKNMFGRIDTDGAYSTVNLYPTVGAVGSLPESNVIGTARILAVENYSGAKSGTVDTRLYRVFLFNVQMVGSNKFERVRSLGTSSPGTFTCEVVLDSFRLTGSVTRVDDANDNLISGAGTSWRNDESQRLTAGDYIQVNAGASPDTSRIYEVAENPSSDTTLKIVSNHVGHSWPAGSKIDYLYALLRTDSKNAGLVYKLPDSPIFSVRGEGRDLETGEPTVNYSAIDANYTTRKTFIGSPTSNILTISGQGENTKFDDFNSISYSVVKLSSGAWLQVLPYAGGTVAAGTAQIEVGAQLRVHFNSADSSGQFQIHYTLVKTGGQTSKERVKKLRKGSFPAGNYANGGSVVASSDVTQISLGKPDVLRITRIVESPNSSTAPSSLEVLPSGHKNVTGIYVLDNGQRDYFYDIAKATLRPGFAKPRGQIRIEFDYFDTEAGGDYYSVDSYPFVGGNIQDTNLIDYGDIPVYTASDGTTYDLASCLDFRPVVGAGGSTAAFNIANGIPKGNVSCDYHFYMPRKDKLVLNSETKQFSIKYGKADENAQFPPDPDKSMVIYELDVGAYTFSTNHVSAKMRENKRYTMRDIGKLENRISNLEYYTSLSLLEKDTNSLNVKDALGRDRFKNGFLVDNFKSFGSSDLSTSEFKCTLDTQSGVARPLIVEDPNPPKLIERAGLESNPDNYRATHNYQKEGEIYLLPFTTQTIINQPLASKYVNVNPYSVFVFVGSVEISPWTDEWRETTISEPLNVKDDSAWQATRSTFGPAGTRIDYTTTVNNWVSVSSTTEGTGRQILKMAGHDIRERFFPNITKAKWNKMEFVTVPEGYANAGERIPIDRGNSVSDELKTTTTQTGERITTNFTSSFVDQGFSAPISLGDRIIDTALIEFIRSREISFTGRAFKPKARVYAFFDGVNVSAYCKPTNGQYGDALVCDGTGTVSGIFKIPDPKTTNIKFKTGDRIFRLTTSNINSLNPAPDSAGDARYSARGWIDTKQETTLSTRLFTIANSTTTSRDPISQILSTTFGETQAVPQDPLAQSFLIKETGGCFITSIDVYFATRPNISGTQAPPITLQLRPMSDDGFPTYKILPFGEVIKQAAEVVTNEFDVTNGRLTITGNPTSSNTSVSGPWTNGQYNPSGIYVSGLSSPYSGNPRNQMVPTNFKFKSPVYVSEGEYYSIVLIANSTDYNVWVAESGVDNDAPVADPNKKPFNVEIGTQEPIDKPVFIDGLLFYSENGINWVQTPRQDMKFRVNKAVFNTNVVGEIDYVNEELPLRKLTLDPLEFLTTSNLQSSTTIRVYHPNHGHTTARASVDNGRASKVIFSPTYTGSYTGIKSVGTTISFDTGFTGNFNLIGTGGYIQHPITKENRRVTNNGATLTIRTPFSQAITSSMVVSATLTEPGLPTVSYPTAGDLGGLQSDILFDYRGYDVIATELDYYVVNINRQFGTVKIQSATPTRVDGTGTKFTEDYVVGDTILINGATYTVASVTSDLVLNITSNYTGPFNTTASLTSVGRRGGSNIMATENKRYEELTLLTTPLEIPGTEISWNVQTISSAGVNDSTTPTYAVQSRKNLVANERIIFDSPMVIGSYVNELPPAPEGSTSVGGPSSIVSNSAADRKSIQVRAALRTTNPNLSPIIDESRMTAFLMSNRLDDPRGTTATAINGGQLINTTFDDYICLPTQVGKTPSVDGTYLNEKLYFTLATSYLIGTITGNSGSRTISAPSGGDSKFSTQLKVGDKLTTINKETYTVVSIISDYELLVDFPIITSFGPGTNNVSINAQNLKIKSKDPNIALHLSNLDVGKYLTIENTNNSNRSFTDKLITAVNYTPENTITDTDLSGAKLIEIEVDHKVLGTNGFDIGSTTIKITQKDRFVDEISPTGGSCGSKYISKKLAVTRPSNALKVMFEGSRDETCTIELYYKLELVNATVPFKDVNWTKATFNTEVNGVFVEVTPAANLSNLDFTEYESTIGDLPAFTAAQVKIVMRGGNPARSVRFKNLRVLVLDD